MIVRRIMKAAAAGMFAASAMATAGRRVRRGMARVLVVVAASLGMVVGLNAPAMAGGGVRQQPNDDDHS